jgi:hypothetical protein
MQTLQELGGQDTQEAKSKGVKGFQAGFPHPHEAVLAPTNSPSATTQHHVCRMYEYVAILLNVGRFQDTLAGRLP